MKPIIAVLALILAGCASYGGGEYVDHSELDQMRLRQDQQEADFRMYQDRMEQNQFRERVGIPVLWPR